MQVDGAAGIPAPGNGLHSNISGSIVTVQLDDVADLARCPVCMGILKETRTISVCMHRFCRTCIEAWLRTNIDNTCPQCRESFASRRNCKPDPTFDQLLSVIFGTDTTAADDALLETPADIIAAAKERGNALAIQREMQRVAALKAARTAPPPPPSTAYGFFNNMNMNMNNNSASSRYTSSENSDSEDDGEDREEDDGSYRSGGARENGKRPASAMSNQNTHNGGGKTHKRKKGAFSPKYTHKGGASSSSYQHDAVEPTKNAAKLQLAEASTPPDAPGILSTNFYGVREHAGKWMAYARHASRGRGIPVTFTLLGHFNSEEEAAHVHDMHTVRTNKSTSKYKFINLNFTYLATMYTQMLADGVTPKGTAAEYEAAVKMIAEAGKAIIAPPGWNPPLKRGRGGRPPKPSSRKKSHAAAAAANAGANPTTSAAAASPSLSDGTGGDYNFDGGYGAAVEQAEAEAAGSLRARELARLFPSLHMIDKSKRPSCAVIDIRAGDDVNGEHVLTLRSLTCPADTTIEWLEVEVAAGITFQRQQRLLASVNESNLGLKIEFSPVKPVRVQLMVSNELDAGVDFTAVYADVGGAEGMTLRPHLTVRELMLMLADCGEDLILEYTVVDE